MANDPSFIQDAAVEPTPTGDAATDRIARLERRLVREKRARLESEQLLESKSRELFERNAELRGLTLALEERVLERTAELASLKEFYEHVLDPELPPECSEATLKIEAQIVSWHGTDLIDRLTPWAAEAISALLWIHDEIRLPKKR